MPRALLSVSEKHGLVHFARELHSRGWELVATGGTTQLLRDAGLPMIEVSEVTGHAEMMQGRIKTLHPAIHAGLLGRRNSSEDMREMQAAGYSPIDLVAVNLYPFRETIRRPEASFADAIENIDIGGPTMLRAAAKNHQAVWPLMDADDYERVLAALDGDDGAADLRRELAAKAFAHTAEYDRAVAAYLEPAGEADTFREEVTVSLRQVQHLRYGENPDQRAALYAPADGATTGIPGLRQLHGKELSFNNLLDVDAALLAISAWHGDEMPACAVIKHNTPCGVAIAANAAEAIRRALATDPVSAFGSVVGFNTEVTEMAATLLRAQFVEAVVAPSFAEAALDLLREKKNLRLLVVPTGPDDARDWKCIRGGFLVQDRMRMEFPEDSWRVATRREPTDDEWRDLRFAWRAVAPVKSNAILLARDGMALGIGAGQMSRVDASRIAVLKAGDNGHDLHGAALASDAFFPFRDGVDAAASAGIRAIIQPGGSVRDSETVAAADEHDIAMVFTGRRLFRH